MDAENKLRNDYSEQANEGPTKRKHNNSKLKELHSS
jgi:hypothetical protein